MEWFEVGVESETRICAFVVIIDNVRERGETPIVHIGAVRVTSRKLGVLNAPRSSSACETANRPASRSSAPGDPGIVKALVGEVRTCMTINAMSLSAKDIQAELCFLR